jgi:hypothetical protein
MRLRTLQWLDVHERRSPQLELADKDPARTAEVAGEFFKWFVEGDRRPPSLVSDPSPGYHVAPHILQPQFQTLRR